MNRFLQQILLTNFSYQNSFNPFISLIIIIIDVLNVLQKLLLGVIALINLLAIGSVQNFSQLEPFYILAICYILTSIVVLTLYNIQNSTGSDLIRIITKMINSGKAIIYLAFLAVVDLLVFMLMVPASSLKLLESDMQTQFIFFGLLIFFIPIILAKFSVEPKGKEVEELFWFQFLEACKMRQPSNEFALFILSRVQLKFIPPSRRSMDYEKEEIQTMSSISDEISTTTFPLDFSAEESNQPIEPGTKNSLFDDSVETVDAEHMYDKYYEEIFEMIPELRMVEDIKPVNLRPELFLNVIIERTVKDEKMVQYFRNCTNMDSNSSL